MDQPSSTTSESTAANRPANPGRRRLGTAGLGGTAVLLTTASRSALGGWGQCTGSEIASGNLSRPGEMNPCGCSPGYWWNVNGFRTWDQYLSGQTPGVNWPRASAKFNLTFGVTYFAPDVYLTACGPGTSNQRALYPSTNGLDNVAMHAVAALFNAAFYGSRYPVAGLQTPAAVKSAFQVACATSANALKAFVTRVDVYGSSNTWCDGKDHGGL